MTFSGATSSQQSELDSGTPVAEKDRGLLGVEPLPEATELARGGTGIHSRFHRTPKAAMVPLGDRLGVGTEGDQREGDRKRGGVQRPRARWVGIHVQDMQSRA